MKIEYDIFSYGTERQSGSNGYMAVSEIRNKKRYIMPLSRDINETNKIPEGSLSISHKYSLQEIALSRFLLIPALFFENAKFNRKSKILVVGCGCVGCATILYLKIKKFKNIYYTTLSNQPLSCLPHIDKQDLNYSNFDLIIDTTGEASILSEILNDCKPFAKIILLGTTRDPVSPNFLIIHRKNLTIYGAHELNGYSHLKRQTIFDKITKKYIRKNLFKSHIDQLVEITQENNLIRNKVYMIKRKNND